MLKGFSLAAAVYEAAYDVSYQYPGYIEPMGSWRARWQRPDNGMDPYRRSIFARARLAEALDMAYSQVRIIQTTTGGGFGGKNSEDANTPIAAFLALRQDGAVRLINTRLEDFLAARASLPARIWLKMG